ncbi:MAG TPA: serine/threonine-protein kinase [Solirubrobacteraceae bacterium]|jgi:serine/threonine-protein kinase
MDSPQSPAVVAGYRIDGTLGEGGMGTVYRATQLSLERVVALKVLTAELSADPDFRERFRREGLLQAALDHPHIVTVYEAGEADDRLFLAMRMVEGPTLKDLILRRQLDDRRTLRLLTQVAEALDAAHAKGLIHRDVKPQNVLVGAGDHAYLADFGLTKGSDDAAMTETGQFVGTIDYISPEQARGARATAGSDVYALTAVLCECLTGRVPYVKATEERVLLAHLSEPPPLLSQLRSDLPAALDDVVAQGMAKDAADRPASAGELMLMARRALGAVPEGAAPGTSAEATRLRPAAGSPTRTPRTGAGAGEHGATRLASATAAADPGATHLTNATVAAGAAAAGAGATAATPGAATSTPTRRGMLVPAVLAAAVLAAALGLLLGGGSGGSGANFANSASAGNLELSFPAGWQHLPSAPAIPGLALAQPLALAQSGNGQAAGAAAARLLAGEVNASGPSLLPATFTAALNGPLPRAAAVRLGALQAYRYSGLSVRGLSGTVTLYAVPTSSGVATVACLGASAAEPAGQCAQIAATLKLSGASAFGLAPSAAYATALGHTFGTLNSAVSAGAGRLRAASSAAAQATAATALAAAYGSASRALAGLTVSPAVKEVNANLAASLAALGRGYSALAAAARAGDDAAYAQAQHEIGSARASTAKALAALGQAGYAVSG